jgi:glycoside/pentoside/hexuronide:cation symporter, GPH family
LHIEVLIGSLLYPGAFMTQPQQPLTGTGRVSWHQLVAYGFGGLIPIALFNIAGQLMGLLGNISLGLSAFWLGVIMIVPKLWDALIDPLVGYVSDNVRTPWGRRRPFILLGGFLVAVTFVGMWWIPKGPWIRSIFVSDAAYNWFQLCFILAGLLIFFTSCTLFEIPHGALGMEMSSDYHERTRLFSAKSFLGNLFALGTPGLFKLSGLEFFAGPGGNLADGMRYVSLFIAILIVPMTCWWFLVLREPGLETARQQKKKSHFWHDMHMAVSNRTFMILVMTIFTLAMGFNFVSLFSYYISIFFLYGGDAIAAGDLLFWGGFTWGATGMLAVVPLNWISRRVGKNNTLLLSITLMCVAQLSKIICYNPELPYLVLIPTVLLSSGMLMFFTLGSSMVGDVCDEDELHSGTRSEGTYYSVYWWFIKMGTAFASFVTGVLLVYTYFDEQQNVLANTLNGSLTAITAEAERWDEKQVAESERLTRLGELQQTAASAAQGLADHLEKRLTSAPQQSEHTRKLQAVLPPLQANIAAWKTGQAQLVAEPGELKRLAEESLAQVASLKHQSASTLLRLRVVEIGLPLVLSVISILLVLKYPLTEKRCYEIKAELARRHAAVG